MGLTQNTERISHEDEGRGLANESTNQGLFKIARNHKKLGRDKAQTSHSVQK